jgi:hypothetical protein
MARVLGYGGIANTNGARDFSTKVVGGAYARSHKRRLIIYGYYRALVPWLLPVLGGGLIF